MITYIVGAAIGFVVNEIINEDKIEKIKQQQAQPQVNNPTIDGTQTINPPPQEDIEEETKEVKFVAKSRGKKK